MRTRTLVRAAVALAAIMVVGPFEARAQERGRTDGPEGSEIGAGGYLRPGTGRLSLGLDWGAALSESKTGRGTPLFLGATLSYWIDDWFIVDWAGQYVARTEAVNLLVGPRVRSAFQPVSLSFGLRAGGIVRSGEGVRFALSPQATAEMELGDSVLFGLGYAVDVPFGSDTEPVHRVFLGVGYRFAQ